MTSLSPKVIGADGKLAEPEPDAHSTVVLKDRMINVEQTSNAPEGFLEDSSHRVRQHEI